MAFTTSTQRSLSDLTDRDVLALAIQSEEENRRSAAFQVVVGGLLVFATGILIGSA